MMASGKKSYKRLIFITLIIALLIAAVAVPTALALTERQAKKLDVQVEAEEVWGQAVEGLAVRLRAKGETTAKRVTLLVDARNDGPGTYRGTRSTHGCWLKVDGKWYVRISSHEIVLSMLLKPGDRKLALTRLHLSAEKSPLWRGGFIMRNGQVPSLGAREIHQSEPLELSPGRHTVRLAFPASRKAYAYSNAVEIEILPAEEKPAVQAEAEETEKMDSLVWGKEVNGLRAAVEFVPEKGSYEQGEVVGIRFHLQNVSNQIINLATPRWWIQSRCLAEDQLGIKMPARTVPEPWGMTTIDRHKLLPGRVIKLESGSLAIAKDKTQRNSLCKYPVRNVVTLKPGRYSLYYWLRFPGIKRLDGDGKVIVPQPDDWQAALETGKRKLVITSESDQKPTMQVSTDTSQEKVKRNKPTPTITDEVHNGTTSYLKKDIQDLSHLEDAILQMINLQPDQIRQLNSVLPHDRKLAAKFDIPEKDLATTPSDVLCKHFFAVSPLRVWFGMYDDRNMGITRALRGSSTLGTLFGREDIIPAIIKVYQETPLDPEKMQDLDPGTTSMSLMTIDEFLMYPPVFEKVAGYEKQILSVLCDRYRKMERINSSRADDPLYGAIYNSTKHLTLLLLERVRPSLHNSLVREREYSKLFAQVENVAFDPDFKDITTEDTSWMGRISSTGKIERPLVPVEAEGEGEKPMLVWGDQVNGLRAAVEFVPEKESYDLEERVGVRFHIQNVSNEDVQFSSMSGRQYWPTVKDINGKEVKVDTWESLGTWSYLHHIIKPGQILTLKNTGLIFSDFHDSALLDKPKWVGIAGVVRCGPGQYSIYYKLSRTLETGVRKITVNERPPVNPRSFELALDQQSMLQAIQTLRHKYRVRICFEQAGSESGSRRHLLTGTFFAPTIPELLDKLTETGLYKWEKFYLTYAVYPKQNSLLRFSVKTDISESPLESVTRVILDQDPRGKQIEIEAVYKGRMRWHLWISRASAMYALSGATARAGISNSDVVWTLTLNRGVPRLYLHRLSQAPQTNEQIKADMPDEKDQLLWGEPVEGVQVRLRTVKSRWNEGAVPRLWANVHNQGMRNLLVRRQFNRYELEVDGRWYRRPLRTTGILMKRKPFPPGRQYDNIAVDLDQWWVPAASQNVGRPGQAEPERLKLTAGKHTIRVAFTATAAKNTPGKPVRAISNPVEIEILPKEKPAEHVDRKKVLGQVVNGLRAVVESTAGRYPHADSFY